MKTKKNVFKEVLGFLLTLLAGALGYEKSPEIFFSFGAVLGAVYFIVTVVKPYIGQKGKWTQVISWATGILLSLTGWYMGFGIFAEMTWYFSLGTGFVISIAANGLYDSEWLESLWRLIWNMFGTKK